MDITKEEFFESFQALYTQQQQQIDILMLILKAHNEQEAEFLDFAHNEKNVFLSDLSPTEFSQLMLDFEVWKDQDN